MRGPDLLKPGMCLAYCLCALMFLLGDTVAQSPVVPAATGPEQPAVPVPPSPPEKQLLDTIEFQNAPVTAVLDYYSRLTGRSIISAPNLATQLINFRSQTKLTIEEAIQALDSVLAINGIGITPVGEKFLKVVQIPTIKQDGLNVLIGRHKTDGPGVEITGGKSIPLMDSMVTFVLPLKYVEPQDVVGALQPYMHAYGQLLPLVKSGALLITDTGANINQMLEIVKYIDQPSSLQLKTQIYDIKYAKASEVLQQLQNIIQQMEQGAPGTAQRRPPVPGQPNPPPGSPVSATGDESAIEGKVVLSADDRTAKLFILSRPSNFPFFEKLIGELDTKVDPEVITKVIAVNYANCEEVSALLNVMISGSTASITRPSTTNVRGSPGSTVNVSQPTPTPLATYAGAGGISPGQPVSGYLQYAAGVRVLPDPRTNSLLLMATKGDMETLAALIKSIDTAVAQVVIEVVIAEVKLDNNLDVGVEMVKRMFQEGQVIQTGSTGTGVPGQPPVDLSSLGGQLLSGLASNTAPLQLISPTAGLTYFMTFKNLKLDAVVRLMGSSGRFKVLSTPIIQTLHNQEASIIVGESRPVPTSTISDIVGNSSTAQRATIEYKDIAIELHVKPRINPDGYVTMDIEQKVNDLGGNVVANGVPIPIITKREAKSGVSVKDGSTIVLGGLIREGKTTDETKVPFLGDIPFFGAIFRTKTTVKARTELVVFIRPTVLRNNEEAVAEALRRAKKLKALEEFNLEGIIKNEGEVDPEEPNEYKHEPGAPFPPNQSMMMNGQSITNQSVSGQSAEPKLRY